MDTYYEIIRIFDDIADGHEADKCNCRFGVNIKIFVSGVSRQNINSTRSYYAGAFKNGLPGIECMTKEETNNDMSQIQQYSAAILATRDELLD